MKKILSFIFVVLLLLSSVIPAFAAESSAVVDYDETKVETDLISVYGDKLSSMFPKNSNKKEMQLITVLEHGYYSDTKFSSSDYGLYIYMYNPSGIKVNGSILDIINMANGWDSKGVPTSYINNYIKLISYSDDYTLLKYKVVTKGDLAYVDKNGARSYTFGSVDIYTGGTNAESHNIAYTYKFSGQGENLSCEKQQITIVEVEVHQTSYLTGNSNKGENYSNQVNSVYFSISDDLMEKYGDLFSVKYEYYKYRTNPIILVEEEHVCDRMYANRGKIVNSTFDYNLNDEEFKGTELYLYRYFFYGKDFYDENLPKSFINKYNLKNPFPNFLTTFFYVPGCTSAELGTVLVSAEEIQEYFLKYNASFVNGKVRDKYSADLFDLDYFPQDDIYHLETRSVDSTFSVQSYLDTHSKFEAFMHFGFGFKQTAGETIEDANYLMKLSLDDFKGATPSTMAKNLLVSSNDIDNLSDFVTTASTEGKSVYLLRYAVTNDYFSMPLDYSQEGLVVDDAFSDDALYVEETVYLDFDIIQFTFKDDLGKETVISVKSDPSDGFTDIISLLANWKFIDFPDLFGKAGEAIVQWFQYLVAVVLVVAVVIIVIKIAGVFKKNEVVVNMVSEDKKRNGKK